MKNQKMNKVAGLLGLALVGGTVALMTPTATPAQAAPYYKSGYNNSPTVMLNGAALNTSVPPIVENGSTLVPMRDIFEALGATVVWDQQDQTIRAQKGSTAIWLQIGSTNARVGNRQVWLNQPPILSMGSTLVPLRFVSEALGANVDWNGSTRVVQITTNENDSGQEPTPSKNTYNGNSNADEQAPPQNTYNENSSADEQAPTEYTNNENSDVDYQDFYENLSPYGQWMQDPQYGYVWQPRVDHSFRPYYSGGHWAMTQYGNMWVSDYSWGWAAFHYGRWNLSDNNGWIWIPGHTWAPAWVSWRSGGGYYGWAPLGPSFNINISIGNYHAPNNWYAFVPQGHIYDHGYSHFSYNNYSPNRRYGVSNQIVNLVQKTTIIHNTYINNHNTYITGPRINEVQSVTHQKVRVYNINNSGRAGSSKIQNNSISIYRPVLKKRPPGQNRTPVAPKHVVKLNQSIFPKRKVTTQGRPSVKLGTPGHPTVTPGNPGRPAVTPGNPGRPAVRPGTPERPTVTPGNPGRPAVRPSTPERPTVRPENPGRPRETPRNSAPNSENNGRNVNLDNARRGNPPARNDRTNPAPNPGNNGGNANANNARKENPPARNDRTNTAPRNPAPNPGRNANDNNGRNRSITPPQTRGNQSKGSTASPTNPKDHSKDNPNQPNGRTNNQQ